MPLIYLQFYSVTSLCTIQYIGIGYFGWDAEEGEGEEEFTNSPDIFHFKSISENQQGLLHRSIKKHGL